MKLGKHLAGMALFFVIFGSTVVITRYLSAPLSTIPPVTLESIPSPHRPVRAITKQQQINYKVRLVSLDLINGESYTTLALKREAGQPLPKKLWVRTYFFTPERPGRVQWEEPVEIRVPEVDVDRVEVTARALCKWCDQPGAPKAGYFARVFVSTESADDTYPPDGAIKIDLMTAIPVLIQAERKTNR